MIPPLPFRKRLRHFIPTWFDQQTEKDVAAMVAIPNARQARAGPRRNVTQEGHANSSGNFPKGRSGSPYQVVLGIGPIGHKDGSSPKTTAIQSERYSHKRPGACPIN
jgi:hypothetical protein